MAITPTFIWTVLPKSFDGAAYGFSVFVAPRLQGAATQLDGYLGNWPQIVEQMAAAGNFWVQVGLPSAPLIPATIDTSPLDPLLWTRVFPPTTPVKPYVFKDHSPRPLYSFSVKTIEDYLESLYTMVGNASATNFPNVKNGALRSLADAFGRARPLIERDLGQQRPPGRGPHPDAALESELTSVVSNLAPLPPPMAELYRAMRFYNRGNQDKWSAYGFKSQHLPVVAAEVPVPLAPPTFDFHQGVALLGDHPFLLRALGLVIDFRVAAADLGGALPASGKVRVQLQWGPAYPAPTDKTPFTRFENNASGFRPAPKVGSDIRGGLLQLGDTKRFGVYQTDVDGNALKTFDFGSNMAERVKQLFAIPQGEQAPWVPVDEPVPEALPAQRNGGVTVTRHGRDNTMFGQFQAQSAINLALDTSELYFDDLARGYRIDVLYKGNWYSLCARQGTYKVGPAIVTPPGPDEGYVKAGSATSDPSNKPKPGNPMYLHEAVFGWDNWSLVVPRPGRSTSYQRDDTTRTQTLKMERVLPQPVAGFDVTPRFAVVPGTLPRMRFGESYAFRARVVDLAGNALEPKNGPFDGSTWQSPSQRYLRYEPVPPPVFVLRAAVTAGESVEHLVVRTQVGPSPIPGAAGIFNEECKRFVAPPKTSQLMAELHGAFDPFFSDPDAAYAIAIREAGSFNDKRPNVKLLSMTGTPILYPSPYHRGDPLPNGAYTVQSGATLTLPYLPDPLSVGIVFDGLPGGAGPIERRFEGASTSWPDVEPFSLVLGKNGGTAPDFAPLPDFTSITLPPATILKLKYSSGIDPEGLDVMGRWSKLNATMRTTVGGRKNQHWMLTPPRTLTVVHAVERPITAPSLYKFSIGKGAGQTFVTIARSHFDCHPHSTGQIELYSRWTDRVDRLSDPGPVDEAREGHALEIKVGYDENSLVEFGQGVKNTPVPTHEFGDTKHRFVQYSGIGTTRFREYFPASITNDPELITLEGPPYESKPAFPYVNVLSSARPDVPKILYVVPTFRWVESGGGKTRKRVGRGLRIYIDRPWYSSGDGELLGVVIPALGTDAPELRQFFSQWGADPMYSSSGPTAPIGSNHFVAEPEAPDFAPVVARGLKLAEREDANVTVDVVGFAPQYEEGRYFIDLVMAPGSAFMPFVRFALVRYQPHSLPGLHLSRVVRTEFAQLVSDRSATITYVGTTELSLNISGPLARNALGTSLPQPSGPPLPFPDPDLQRSTPIVLSPRSTMVKDDFAGAGHLLRVRFERLDNPASEDLGWVALRGEWLLDSYTQQTALGVVYWQGKVPLPSAAVRAGKRIRVVLLEYELIQTDPELAESVPVFNPGGIPIRQRLLYADRFEIT